MNELGLYEKDIEEVFVRSSGSGGQNVNKVSTCVLLYHHPSDTFVKCQQERRQSMNRLRARWILVEKVREKIKAQLSESRYLEEKKKRQNRKKPKRLKEKILEYKKRKSDKKKLRAKVRFKSFED